MDKIKNLLSKSCCNPQVLMPGGSHATRMLRVKLKIEEGTNPVFVLLFSSMDCSMQRQGKFYASSVWFLFTLQLCTVEGFITISGSNYTRKQSSELNKMRSREARKSSKVAEVGLEYQFLVPLPSPSLLLLVFYHLILATCGALIMSSPSIFE